MIVRVPVAAIIRDVEVLIAVEVGFVVGMMPATTPAGVPTSMTPVRSSRERIPTVFSSLIEFQVPSAPKRFFRTL